MVVVCLAVDIGVTRREESSSIQWSVAVQTIGDFVLGCRTECLFVGLPDSLEGAVLAVVVALGADRIVGTFVVVRVGGDIIQLVDNVRVHKHRVARVDSLRLAAARYGTLALSSLSRLYRIVLRCAVPPHGRRGTHGFRDRV